MAINSTTTLDYWIAIFLRNQKGNANIVDGIHILSEMTMARSKIWMILDKARTNAWWGNMSSNNSEWKENIRLSQPRAVHKLLGNFLATFQI